MLRTPVRQNRARQRKVRSIVVPAPVEGWDSKSALASMKDSRAVQLKNWFPQPGYVEVRRGYREHAPSIGTPTTSIETLAVWNGPASSKMFAAADGSIWDCTSAASATEDYALAATSDRWQWTNHTTSGGHYLWMCNGSDVPIHYNGTAWAAPSITGATPANIISVISHKRRLWFVFKDSTKGGYLAADAIEGAVTEFQFGSLFTKGGHLKAIATWTRDGGSGPDDYLVAISSKGQAALYAGTDPAAAETWALVGVFDVPAPIGRRCFHKFGGDLLLITLEGVFPLSQLLAVDQSKASRVSISDNISISFNTMAQAYKDLFGWELCVYPRGTRVVVNIPTAENSTSSQYVMNTLTGAWCEFDAHNANCWAIYNDQLYFGANTGVVYRADTGRADVDQPITAIGQTAYSAAGAPRLKRYSMIRPLITAEGSNRPSIGLSIDFAETQAMSALSATGTSTTSSWDSAVWDTATWGGTGQEISTWANAVGLGTFGSVKFQAQTGTGLESEGGAWGDLWGTAVWGVSSLATQDETMRIQGFLVLSEDGEFI